ncbi:E3 ubiquitin-protein ligase HRD1 [Folsomia candida]|uniref:E3 ubiquitin-protein ligase HRD1 n=1 Tax=Folsomia candida TaxID=158441 RepID=A0A226E058_FOLCA|nr:E3 ubiquitin-protein ligase HRD1 [Folsomia candida]
MSSSSPPVRPPRRTPQPSRPVTRNVSILSKRNTKSLWKMIRSMIIPTRLVTAFASCGGGGNSVAARRKRRLDRAMKNGGQAPLERRIISSPPVEALANLSLAEEVVEPESQIQTQTVEVQIEIVPNAEATTTVTSPTDGDISLGNTGSTADTADNTVESVQPPPPPPPEEIIVRLREKKDSATDRSSIVDADKFHGWRKSSIDVNTEPPLTLSMRVEFERSIGNSSGLYGYGGGLVARLFTCDLGLGRFIPIDELVLHSDFHDKGIKAGFICIICRDDFLELPDAQGDEGHMVATKCGHLYHETCLQSWFASKSRKKTNGATNPGQPCPHCQSPIQYEDIIRLFPAQV